MRRIISIIVLVVTAGSLLALRPATTTVEGVWMIVHFTVSTDEGTVEGDINQPNLMIFSARHYASIFPSGGGGEMSAQGGTYEVNGDEIRLRIIATSPTMPPEQEEESATFEVDDGTLVMTYTDGPVVTFTRVE